MKRKLIAGVFVAGAFIGTGALDAGAAPISCPGQQEVVKTSDGWTCENPAGNYSGAEDPKNPNADKHKF